MLAHLTRTVRLRTRGVFTKEFVYETNVNDVSKEVTP
jgi:hypothetical protein